MKFAARIGLAMTLCASSFGTTEALAGTPSAGTHPQHFVCNTGYTLEKCHRDVAVLRKALSKYPVEQLGEWTWVLVRSADWKEIRAARGLDPNSPAFTFYEKRETFFEEAMLADVPARSGALIVSWSMSLPNLLDFAIAHEMGHALCNEKEEFRAERVARMLREGRPPSCDTTSQAKKQRNSGQASLMALGNAN